MACFWDKSRSRRSNWFLFIFGRCSIRSQRTWLRTSSPDCWLSICVSMSCINVIDHCVGAADMVRSCDVQRVRWTRLFCCSILLCYPFKHEPIWVSNHPHHFSERPWILCCLSTACCPFMYFSLLFLPLSLAVILLSDFHPVESRECIYGWQLLTLLRKSSRMQWSCTIQRQALLHYPPKNPTIFIIRWIYLSLSAQ